MHANKIITKEAVLLGALKMLINSADCEWENKNQGHDWADAMMNARSVIKLVERNN